MLHTIKVRRVFVPGVGKRFVIIDEDGTQYKRLYKTQRNAFNARFWMEKNRAAN